jgi:hypothetical protein
MYEKKLRLLETLSHNVVSSTHSPRGIRTHNVRGDSQFMDSLIIIEAPWHLTPPYLLLVPSHNLHVHRHMSWSPSLSLFDTSTSIKQ